MSVGDPTRRRVLAVCSLLHEPAGRGSAGRGVLARTLNRLQSVAGVGATAVLCWQDQADAARGAIGDAAVTLLPHGPRRAMPQLDAVTAAGKWLDGWRGGLLQTTPHDCGYFAKSVAAVARAGSADFVLLIDPASALLDVNLVARLFAHAADKPGHDYYFTPAAPGLTGLLLSRKLVDELAATDGPSHPGRLLHYRPDTPQLDPLAADNCCHGPTPAARTLHDFRLDSDAKLRWATTALGQPASAGWSETPETLIRAADAAPDHRPPRDITLELTTRRHTRPIWLRRESPETLLPHLLNRALAEIADLADSADDLRLTLGGRGDPLCCEAWPAVIDAARQAGVSAVHIETDLLCDADAVTKLAASADVVSVHLPAVTADTYAEITGVDRYDEVKHNVARLLAARRGTPIVVPTFVKCRQNLSEMEAWYDAWLAAAGSAVIRGPDAFGNDPPADVAAARMIRGERRGRELRILADGRLTDDRNRPLGRLGETTAAGAWTLLHTSTPNRTEAA